MGHHLVVWLLMASSFLTFAPPSQPANPCGNQGTNPQIFSSTVVSPPTLDDFGNAPANWRPANGRLTRGSIQYVSIDSLSAMRLELITDQCTFIKGVQFGSRVLTTVRNYTNGYFYETKDLPTQPSDRTRHGYDVWVFFPPDPDGSTDVVTITVGRAGGAGTATVSFSVVRVKTVEKRDADAAVGISRAELFNMFGRSLFAKFNGAANKEVVDTPLGQVTIYDYDPSTLQVSVDAQGISFGFRFKIAIPCKPTVYASGTFRILADAAKGFSVDWVNAAHGTLHWPPACEVLRDLTAVNLMISRLIDELVEGKVGSSVTSKVEEP